MNRLDNIRLPGCNLNEFKFKLRLRNVGRAAFRKMEMNFQKKGKQVKEEIEKEREKYSQN